MKFLLLLLTLTIYSCLSAQNTPAPSSITDSMSQYSKDTVGIFTKIDVEASYPGGLPAWRKFLEQNLDANAPINEIPKRKKYFQQTAICQFIVCKDGSICDIKVINKVLPSIKKEVERVIALSGKWIPAQHTGREVKAYRKQPITFVVTTE